MAWQITAVRLGLRLLPGPLRERLAVRLFVKNRAHGEPARESRWRDKGTTIETAGHAAVSFGPAAGATVLLMHGWEGRGLQLSAYIEPLTERGFRVVALDGPGHGKSPGVGGLPTFTTFLADCIEEVGPVAIVAHSLGASAAIVAASRTQYEGRILCLGGPAESQEVFTRARTSMRLPESGRERFIGLLRERYGSFAAEDVLAIEACARSWGGDVCAVLAAHDDEVPLDESKRVVEAAGGTWEVVDARHRDIMWTPDAVAAGMRFLSGIRPGSRPPPPGSTP